MIIVLFLLKKINGDGVTTAILKRHGAEVKDEEILLL